LFPTLQSGTVKYGLWEGFTLFYRAWCGAKARVPATSNSDNYTSIGLNRCREKFMIIIRSDYLKNRSGISI